MRIPNLVRYERRVEMNAINPSPWRYSKSGTPLDRKLSYTISIRGQTRPILVREISPPRVVTETETTAEGTLVNTHYEIIDGHRIYDAMLANGAETCTVVSVGQVDDIEALMMSVEHNESREGHFDMVKLAEVFIELSARYTADEIASRIDWDAEQVEDYKSWVDPTYWEFFRRTSDPDSGVVKRAASPNARQGYRSRSRRLKILRDHMRELKGVKLSVWLAYCIQANVQGVKKLSLAQLAKTTGYTEDIISAARTELIKKGWLDRIRFMQSGGFENSPAQARVEKPCTERKRTKKKGQFTEDWYYPRMPEPRPADAGSVPLPENSGTASRNR
jgi:hypothetical protein